MKLSNISMTRMSRNILTSSIVILTTMVTLLLLASWNDRGSVIFKKFTESLTIQLKKNYTRAVEEMVFSVEKILHGKDCSSQRPSVLCEKIIEYYTRDTWWDFKLCSQKKYVPILSNVSDLVPLKTFNKEVSAHEEPSRNIFFFENNCKMTLEFYVLCSLESAAFQNPEATIFLLTVIPFLEDSSGQIRRLLKSFPNIEILQADYDNLLQDTPLDAFKSRGIWTNNAGFLNAHLSDLMRVALIWKEGGTYLDSDIISVKKLPQHKHALMHGKRDISNGFIKGSKHHEYLSIVMNYQKTSYKADVWNSIGPSATTKGVNLYCNMTSYKPGLCKDISILSIKSFTPVIWDEVEKLMGSHSNIDSKVFLEHSFGIHTSHKIVGQRLNELGNDSLYDKITKEFCPRSYKIQVSKPDKFPTMLKKRLA